MCSSSIWLSLFISASSGDGEVPALQQSGCCSSRDSTGLPVTAAFYKDRNGATVCPYSLPWPLLFDLILQSLLLTESRLLPLQSFGCLLLLLLLRLQVYSALGGGARGRRSLCGLCRCPFSFSQHPFCLRISCLPRIAFLPCAFARLPSVVSVFLSRLSLGVIFFYLRHCSNSLRPFLVLSRFRNPSPPKGVFASPCHCGRCCWGVFLPLPLLRLTILYVCCHWRCLYVGCCYWL